jgi:prophage regulatory protein
MIPNKNSRTVVSTAPSKDHHEMDLAPAEESAAATRIASPVRLLRLPQVKAAVGLGRAAIYQLQREGRFPKSVRIIGRTVGWVEDEIQAWLAQRITERDSRSKG